MRVLVLGAGAGGGVPQWNSNSEACRRARRGEIAPLTQSSVAVSADGASWVLLNASPDLRQQINAHAPLHPRRGTRDSPIVSVVLTNGDVDHVAGLLSLREGHPFCLYASDCILETLDRNSIFGVLGEAVPRRVVEVMRPFDPWGPAGGSSGLMVEAFPVPGKVALYLEEERSGLSGAPGDTVGLKIRRRDGEGGSFCYIPGCARIDADVLGHVRGSDLLLFDGTLWRDDEMIRQGAGHKTGQRMGHVSMSGPDGAIAGLAGASVGRRVFIHINNTNPVLLPESPERAELARSGWEVAHDGMEISL